MPSHVPPSDRILRRQDRRRPACAALLAAAVVLGSAGVVRTAPPLSADQVRGEVSRLIKELRAPRREVRERAERLLLSLGPPALAWFPAEEEVAGEGVRETLGRVREQLERDLAEETTRPGQLTLKGRRSVAGWAEEITRQTGNRILVDSLPEDEQAREVACDRAGGDFWPEFDAWVALAGLQWQHDAEQVALRLKPVDPAATAPLQVAYAGPHRVILDSATWKLREGQPPLLRLRALVTSEPRLRHLLFRWTNADQQVGPSEKAPATAFAPFSPEGKFELPPAGGHAHLQCDVVPPLPTPDGRWQWRGEMHATVAPLNLPATFRDLNHMVKIGSAERPRRRRGGVLVTLEEVQLRDETDDTQAATIKIAVAYNRGGAEFESHRAWLLHNDAWLEGADGQRVPREAISEPTFHADGAIGMSYRFGGLPKPWTTDTFVYSVPALIIDLPVKFTLEFAPPKLP